MSDPLSIRQLLDSILSGNLRIPAFQRGFVWEPDQVAYFMDSLYKGYPFGSLLLWRSKTQLKIEKKLGPFELPGRDPEYPIDYILDGQQRATSLFGVFQTELKPTHQEAWTNVFFDFKAEAHSQESQFLVLQQDQINVERHFPLNALFDTVSYRKATGLLDEKTVGKIDKLQERFKEVRIPVQSFATEDRAVVAIVFERVNRKGVPLDTLQLLSAWTWSDEFDLQQQFSDLKDELKPFGFDELGADTTLLLRCCAAVIANDAAPDALIELNGTDVRSRFEEVVNGIHGAIDFLRKNLGVFSIENLPFQTVLVPLTVFFSHPANKQIQFTHMQTTRLLRWFWKTSFSRRYSSGVLRNLNSDIEDIQKLKSGNDSSLDSFPVTVGPSFFWENLFRVDSVNTKTFVLMLANQQPKSFISGTGIDLSSVLRDYNRNEFHHMMPRDFVKKKVKSGNEKKPPFDVNCLANFCFLSRTDNNQLGGKAPSEYRKKMPDGAGLDDILTSALCPHSLFEDDFDLFIGQRADLLAQQAALLIG